MQGQHLLKSLDRVPMRRQEAGAWRRKGLSVALGRSLVWVGHGGSSSYDFMRQRCEQSAPSLRELEAQLVERWMAAGALQEPPGQGGGRCETYERF